MFRIILFCLLAALSPFSAQAQDPVFPARPLRLIVPYPAGGTMDAIARLLMEKLSASLGQPAIVDNRGGAGGVIAMTAVARSAPDGYTMGFGNIGPNAIAVNFQQKLPYDPVRDFQPVTLVSEMPVVLVVNAASPFATLQDYLKAAKDRPGAISFASTGPGSFSHLTGEMFARAAGIKLLHVPYKGGPEAMQDLLAGRTDSTFAAYDQASAQIKAGKLRALAVTSARRMPQLPETPTVGEKAIPEFEAVGWFGILLPAGTPKNVVDRLQADFAAALKSEAVQARLATQGLVPRPSSPAEFAERIKADVAKWAPIARLSEVQN